jgi:DNA-binding response OmpR family regulator
VATVLIIDDDRLLRRVMTRVIRNMGHDVLQAEDGERGLSLFRAHRPELVITDIVMPRQEGFQTIRELRREFPDVKIIATSGGGRERTPTFLIDAGRVGADMTLSKPFRPVELISAVAKLLHR